MYAATLVCAGWFLFAGGWEPAEPPVAALFSDAAYDGALVAPLTALLEEAGYVVTPLDAAALCDADMVNPARFALLVLPHAARLPMDSVESVREYLKGGGNLFALNTPAWRERLVQVDGAWQTLEAWRKANANVPAPNVFLHFGDESLSDWYRSAKDGASHYHFSIIPDALAPGVSAFQADMPEMEGWDSATRPFDASPFPENHVVTVFSARGRKGTNRLALEWRERDGSRWIAVVPLSEEWQRYLLVPEDFKFWESVPERANSTFNPAQADLMSFTIAYTHTGHLSGDHQFQVAQVGSAPLEYASVALRESAEAPILELISPEYKFYEMDDVASLAVAADQSVLADTTLPKPRRMLSFHPRPEAGGFDKGRPWRWMPLLEAYSPKGDLRGCPAAMLVHNDGPYRGGVWAAFAIDDTDWYDSEAGRAVLRDTLQRMRLPVYLVDGGAHYYTYFEDQSVRLGATLVNTGMDTVDPVTLRLEVRAHDGAPVWQRAWSALTLPPGAPAVFEETWTPDVWTEEGFMVTAELVCNDLVVDTASHEVFCWRPKQDPSHVTVENGRFMLDGRRWRPNGVNYMPSSGIAIEWYKYFEQWLGAAAYHPRVIQRDLERCAAMNFNSLSIFVYREAMEAQNLLDMLRRMEALGLKANLSLRPGTPMDFPWDSVRELIEYFRLAESDTVVAYDLAWEPQFRDWERDPFNPEWEAWIVERYGSLEHAEQDWGCPVPRNEDGDVVNFEPYMIESDGPWNRMIAAYRRFLDTLLYEKYAEARRLVRTIDPHTLVSFRMSMAGDPTDRATDSILYDFAYLAGAVDMLQPEGYGRIGDWERIKPGWFTYEYGRWANPALPVLWAEAGVHVWDMAEMRFTDERLAFQGRYYEDFYRMLTLSGADGIYWWWYPGGFRTNENSDYGIINPDGTDRPVTRVLRERGPRYAAAPDARPVDVWLEFDRDAHNNGLTGVYDALEGAFWAAIKTGKTPGLRTEATGSDSTNCPALAVGNTPMNGANPPKHLDAFFDLVEVMNADGVWQRVLSRDAVIVAADAPIRARLTVTNLGEAALATPEEAGDAPGGVFITLTGANAEPVPLPRRLKRFEQTTLEIPLGSVPENGTQTLVLGVEARGRTPFGPRFAVRLEAGDLTSS